MTTRPRPLALLDRLTDSLALVVGAMVVVLSLLIFFDIVTRSLFRYSLQGTDELGGYTLAMVGSLGLAYTLLQRGHPRIDLGLRLLPLRLQAWLHVLAYATLTGFALFMGVHAFGELRETVAFGTITNTPLRTPLWVPQTLWLAGIVIFVLAGLACTLHGLLLALDDAPDEVARHYGPLTVEDEVHEYVADVQPTGQDGPAGQDGKKG